MDESADIQARPYGGMFCERAGLFLFISPARLLATFISRLCCSTCILWWRRRRRSFSAAPKSAGTNNKTILLAPQEGVEEVCVLQCTRVIINICFEPSFSFFSFFFFLTHTPSLISYAYFPLGLLSLRICRTLVIWAEAQNCEHSHHN